MHSMYNYELKFSYSSELDLVVVTGYVCHQDYGLDLDSKMLQASFTLQKVHAIAAAAAVSWQLGKVTVMEFCL